MFVNEYLMDKKLIKEYVFKVILKKVIYKFLIVILAGLLLYILSDSNLRYVMLTCSLICIIFLFLYPKVLVETIEKEAKTLHNGKIEKTIIKFDSNIIMEEGNTKFTFEYSQIKEITETPNFVVLQLGRDSAVLVYKDGFTKGKKDKFIEYIKDKI